MGGGLGLLLAVWGTRALASLTATHVPPEGVLTMEVSLPEARYPDEKAQAAFQREILRDPGPELAPPRGREETMGSGRPCLGPA